MLCYVLNHSLGLDLFLHSLRWHYVRDVVRMKQVFRSIISSDGFCGENEMNRQIRFLVDEKFAVLLTIRSLASALSGILWSRLIGHGPHEDSFLSSSVWPKH